jgi:cytochrome c553
MKTINIALASLLMVPVVSFADMDRCVSCHGVDFEKSALGVSKIVKNLSEKEIKKALDGYKHGKGGSMKDLMIQEVNLGVDTDAMSADVYNEARTKGFDEPNDDFIFQKRLSVRTLHKIKTNIKKASKKDMKKISSQIKSYAFSMYAYDKVLQKKVDFSSFKPKKLTKKDILQTVTKVKKCVDHSFDSETIASCRVDFFNLAGNLVKNEEKKMKAKSKKNKKPLYTGTGAVDMSKYLD